MHTLQTAQTVRPESDMRLAAAEAAARYYIHDWPVECRVRHCPFLSLASQEVFEVIAATTGRNCGSVTVFIDGDRVVSVKGHSLHAPTV